MSTIITGSMIPSQRNSRQSVPNPREFSSTDWMFSVSRDNQTWAPGNSELSSNNFRNNNEPYKLLNIDLGAQLVGTEPPYGFGRYKINPLAQEQTNAKTAAFQSQTFTRMQGFRNPAVFIRTTNQFDPYPNPMLVYKGRS